MNTDFNNYLFEERAKYSAEHAKARFVSQVGMACITTGLLWLVIPHYVLFFWFLISIFLSVCMVFIQTSLVPTNPNFTQQRWSFATVVCSTIIGFFWSLAPSILFVSDNTLFIVFVMSLYAGYISGSLSVNSAYKFSFNGFSIAISLPLITRLLYEGGIVYNTVAGLMLFYVAMLTYVMHNMHKQFISTVKIQYKNERLVQELAAEKNVVENAVAAKDKFLAAASHDLRQPLNAISLFTDALKPLQTDEQGRDILVKVRQCLNGLNGMLHGMLDISRLDAEGVDNNPKHIDLKPVLEQLCEEYQLNTKRLSITANIADSTIAFVDQTILNRVLHNLLDNAVKYTHKGHITLSAHQANRVVNLIIQDTGIGIPEDKIDTIFDEFQQLNNPERDREKGLGLGLAIVKRLCKIANIKINLHSKLNEGTRVSLQLLPGAEQKQSIQADTASFDASLINKFVLVIDDEKHILDGMQYLLSSYGCTVLQAESLSNALDKLKQQTAVPDMIISDLRLRKGLSGIDAIEGIHEEFNKAIPALLVTGDTAPDKISEVELQKFDTLYKPINSDQLKLKMIELINY